MVGPVLDRWLPPGGIICINSPTKTPYFKGKRAHPRKRVPSPASSTFEDDFESLLSLAQASTPPPRRRIKRGLRLPSPPPILKDDEVSAAAAETAATTTTTTTIIAPATIATASSSSFSGSVTGAFVSVAQTSSASPGPASTDFWADDEASWSVSAAPAPSPAPTSAWESSEAVDDAEGCDESSNPFLDRAETAPRSAPVAAAAAAVASTTPPGTPPPSLTGGRRTVIKAPFGGYRPFRYVHSKVEPSSGNRLSSCIGLVEAFAAGCCKPKSAVSTTPTVSPRGAVTRRLTFLPDPQTVEDMGIRINSDTDNVSFVEWSGSMYWDDTVWQMPEGRLRNSVTFTHIAEDRRRRALGASPVIKDFKLGGAFRLAGLERSPYRKCTTAPVVQPEAVAQVSEEKEEEDSKTASWPSTPCPAARVIAAKAVEEEQEQAQEQEQEQDDSTSDGEDEDIKADLDSDVIMVDAWYLDTATDSDGDTIMQDGSSSSEWSW